MKVTEATYTPKVAEAKVDAEVVALVQPHVERGIDAAFAVETTKADAAADKRKIQDAVNSLGHTAREVEKMDEKEFAALDDRADVTLTFVIRPKRKPRQAKDESGE